MITLPKPSKKIIFMISVAVIVVGAIGVNKFWGVGSKANLITPGYSAPDIAQGEAPANSIDGTAFLQQFATSSAATSTDDTPATPSREIARTLFANTAYLESNNSLDDTSKAALVQNALNQIQESFGAKQYDESGLSYITNETPEALRFYATSFATNQIGMILEMQGNVAKIEQDLSVMGDIYAQEAKDLYALKVPKDLVSIHLQIVNNFSTGAAAFYALANERNDPLSVPVAINAYEVASSEQNGLMSQLASYFATNGIIFTSDEPGGYWNSFATKSQ